MARRIVCRCRSRPSSPIHAMSAAYSRSSLRSKQPPPSARHVRPHGPEPSAPHGFGLQERICSSSCLSWLHLLKSWSLRQSRGGSRRSSTDSVSADRLDDVLELLLAAILEANVQLAFDFAVDLFGNQDAARIGNPLQPDSNGDPVAVEITILPNG